MDIEKIVISGKKMKNRKRRAIMYLQGKNKNGN